MTGEILKIEDGKVTIGIENGRMVMIPIADVSYLGPNVGDQVRLYRNGDHWAASGPILKSDGDDRNGYSEGKDNFRRTGQNDTRYADSQYENETYTDYRNADSQYQNETYRDYGNIDKQSRSQNHSNGYCQNRTDRRNETAWKDQNRKVRVYNKHVFTWIFTAMLGGLGVDRFCRGEAGLGILKLFTFGGWGIWWLADFIIALSRAYGAPYRNVEDFTFIDGQYSR